MTVKNSIIPNQIRRKPGEADVKFSIETAPTPPGTSRTVYASPMANREPPGFISDAGAKIAIRQAINKPIHAPSRGVIRNRETGSLIVRGYFADALCGLGISTTFFSTRTACSTGSMCEPSSLA